MVHRIWLHRIGFDGRGGHRGGARPSGPGSRCWTLVIASLLLLVGGSAPAAEEPAKLKEVLERIMPGRAVDSIKPTPIPGLHEVQVAGQVFYFTEDGNFMLRGDLIDVDARSNLTEQTRRGIRLAVLEELGEDSMVVFAPEGEVKHTITVFTDVDCPYCAKLHREVPKMNELGIKVRYTAFPRAGIPSKNYDRMVSVWCAKDRQQAMSDAKAQRPIESATCENSVEEHFGQGHALGVQGTPSIILDSGVMLNGYRPYRQLQQILEEG